MSRKTVKKRDWNLSKRKNHEVLRHLFEVERFVGKASNDPRLLHYLNEAKKTIGDVRYGLVFEEHSEPIESVLGEKDVDLVESKRLSIGRSKRPNILIEGENLAVLVYLQKSFLGKVDIVYADPPYNTGMDFLTYDDDNHSDPGDSYIHSKWLSFMNKRLEAAYRLLSPRGVLIVHVDEHEKGALLLLTERVFGEGNIMELVWPKTNPRFDRNRVERPFRNIKIVHENILVCFKNWNGTRLRKIMQPSWNGEGKYEEAATDMETILKELGTTSSAKDELRQILGSREVFRTPKPVKLVKELVRSTGGKKALVLDIFAGSGTTGHAVMDLNKEDGGTRRFILVNNNENGICRKVTYERLKRVLLKEPYQETLKYFRTRFVPRTQSRDSTA